MFANGEEVPYHVSILSCKGVVPRATRRGSIISAVIPPAVDPFISTVGCGLYSTCSVCIRSVTTAPNLFIALFYILELELPGAGNWLHAVHPVTYGMNVGKVITIAREVAALDGWPLCYIYGMERIRVRTNQPRLCTALRLAPVAADDYTAIHMATIIQPGSEPTIQPDKRNG